MTVQIKRAYDKPSPKDGHRVLVDRLWPRGAKKESLKIDEWLKDVAPSNGLRKWFGHDPEKWKEFLKRYREELKGNEAFAKLRAMAKKQRLTLVYAAKDEEHNNAVALKTFLER